MKTYTSVLAPHISASLDDDAANGHGVDSLIRREKYVKIFRMSEVAEHCEYNSCWIVIDNMVYDVTNFKFIHPGGLDILLEHAGRDCTIPFRDKGHSLAAIKLLKDYKIGELHEDERIS